jgi:hypothetical protein
MDNIERFGMDIDEIKFVFEDLYEDDSTSASADGKEEVEAKEDCNTLNEGSLG